MKHLSTSVSRVSKQNFSRKYIALGRIVNCWAEIIGADMANHAQPVQLITRKPKNKRSKPECTLDIACSSSHAMILQYQKPVILERMVALFGDNWVNDIRFSPARELPKRPKKKIVYPKRPLEHNDHSYIDETLAHIDDDPLKQRLERLGQYILKETEL